MAKKRTIKHRTQVKDLPKKTKALTGQEMKKVHGATSRQAAEVSISVNGNGDVVATNPSTPLSK